MSAAAAYRIRGFNCFRKTPRKAFPPCAAWKTILPERCTSMSVYARVICCTYVLLWGSSGINRSHVVTDDLNFTIVKLPMDRGSWYWKLMRSAENKRPLSSVSLFHLSYSVLDTCLCWKRSVTSIESLQYYSDCLVRSESVKIKPSSFLTTVLGTYTHTHKGKDNWCVTDKRSSYRLVRAR